MKIQLLLSLGVIFFAFETVLSVPPRPATPFAEDEVKPSTKRVRLTEENARLNKDNRINWDKVEAGEFGHVWDLIRNFRIFYHHALVPSSTSAGTSSTSSSPRPPQEKDKPLNIPQYSQQLFNHATQAIQSVLSRDNRSLQSLGKTFNMLHYVFDAIATRVLHARIGMVFLNWLQKHLPDVEFGEQFVGMVQHVVRKHTYIHASRVEMREDIIVDLMVTVGKNNSWKNSMEQLMNTMSLTAMIQGVIDECLDDVNQNRNVAYALMFQTITNRVANTGLSRNRDNDAVTSQVEKLNLIFVKLYDLETRLRERWATAPFTSNAITNLTKHLAIYGESRALSPSVYPAALGTYLSIAETRKAFYDQAMMDLYAFASRFTHALILYRIPSRLLESLWDQIFVQAQSNAVAYINMQKASIDLNNVVPLDDESVRKEVTSWFSLDVDAVVDDAIFQEQTQLQEDLINFISSVHQSSTRQRDEATQIQQFRALTLFHRRMGALRNKLANEWVRNNFNKCSIHHMEWFLAQGKIPTPFERDLSRFVGDYLQEHVITPFDFATGPHTPETDLSLRLLHTIHDTLSRRSVLYWGFENTYAQIHNMISYCKIRHLNQFEMMHLKFNSLFWKAFGETPINVKNNHPHVMLENARRDVKHHLSLRFKEEIMKETMKMMEVFPVYSSQTDEEKYQQENQLRMSSTKLQGRLLQEARTYCPSLAFADSRVQEFLSDPDIMKNICTSAFVAVWDETVPLVRPVDVHELSVESDLDD